MSKDEQDPSGRLPAILGDEYFENRLKGFAKNVIAMRGGTLIIGFEEPEIYLHPIAAKQMRDTIYELAGSRNNQIVCTMSTSSTDEVRAFLDNLQSVWMRAETIK